jgi:predicted protein tyrosine phosphatase
MLKYKATDQADGERESSERESEPYKAGVGAGDGERAESESESDMNKLLCGNLWIGSYFAARDARQLRRARITAVLSCARQLAVPEATRGAAGISAARVRRVSMDDLEDVPAAAHLRTAAATLHEWLDVRKERVLCFCAAGISRSVACVVAYLVLYKAMTPDAALALIRRARPQAAPNDGFMSELAALYTLPTA